MNQTILKTRVMRAYKHIPCAVQVDGLLWDGTRHISTTRFDREVEGMRELAIDEWLEYAGATSTTLLTQLEEPGAYLVAYLEEGDE